MMLGYHVAVTVHVLAALLWLGGMLFLAIIGAPILRAIEPPSLRADLFRRLGERFRLAGWIAIAVLVVTGVAMLQMRGWLARDLLASSTFWASGLGRILAWKLGTVAVMVGLSAMHDFVLGPAASRAPPGSPRALRLRSWSSWAARVNAVVGVALVWIAVRLARGG